MEQFETSYESLQEMSLSPMEDIIGHTDEEGHQEEDDDYSVDIQTDPRMEEYETNLLFLITDVAYLVRSLYFGGYRIPAEGHPVNIGFCFDPGSPMRGHFRDGYKLNEFILEEWEDIDQLICLLGNSQWLN